MCDWEMSEGVVVFGMVIFFCEWERGWNGRFGV